MAASWKPEVCPLLGKGEEEAGRLFKCGRSRDSRKLGFRAARSPTTRYCRLERRT